MPSVVLDNSITDVRVARWVSKFSGYRVAPTRHKIIKWLKRFDLADQPTAAQLLDHTTVLREDIVQQGYRAALQSLPGWSLSEAGRRGRWYFVGWGGAGESGLSMLHSFREANRLEAAKYNKLFVTPAEIPALLLTKADKLVFVDDFAGTGSQLCTSWPEMAMLIGAEPKIYLILTALTEAAEQRIRSELPFDLRFRFRLGPKRSVFSNESPFSHQKQARIRHYCEKADRKNPEGFGGCGLLFVLPKKTPNNTIPILHSNHGDWRGLFPRHLAGKV